MMCNDYNQIRSNYSLQYFKKINMNTIEFELFDLISDFKFEECDNCNKLDDELNEGLCDNCLFELDENNKELNEECPICKEDDNDCLKFKVKTSCGHIFHKECLKSCRDTRMKERNNNENECPYCRTKLTVGFFHSL
jgi:hypothetical protein